MSQECELLEQCSRTRSATKLCVDFVTSLKFDYNLETFKQSLENILVTHGFSFRTPSLEQEYRYRPRKRKTGTIGKAYTYFFFFFLFIYQRSVPTQPRGEVAQRGMKARHQFKKSTPLVVAGKNAAPRGGGWPRRNPCQSDLHRLDLSLVE